ncbi:MAG: molybdate ABC transporter substrate-binding protein [Paracoccaceae bacterium]
MKTWFYIRALATTGLLLLSSTSQSDTPITVFAAASLKSALDQVAKDWPGKVTISYGGSGTLARQVDQGAPADVLILANAQWMDWLQDKGIIDDRRRRNLLSNALVLVAEPGHRPLAADHPGVILNALNGGRLSIGQTRGVPAGIYGRAWLENIGLWQELSPHLAETENVRAALAYVIRSEAPLGLVYASDATDEPGVTVVYEVPVNLHPEIVYPAAAITPRGEVFLKFLSAPTTLQIFEAHGFAPADPDS